MTTIKEQIRTMLTSDTTYLSLMGSPASPPYQTFYLRPPERPTFPQVVYELRPAIFNTDNDRALITSQIDLSITVWAKSNVYEIIVNRIIWLLHQVENSNGFKCIINSEPVELYDDEFNAYGLNITFRVHYRRCAI